MGRDSVLHDPRAETAKPSAARSLGAIRSDLLRVECRKCSRIVEISRSDAIRLYGPQAAWRDVGTKLLDDGCQHRSGNRDSDGCWPDFRNG